MPDVSIVIPLYNEADTLAAVLTRLLVYTEEHPQYRFEVVVVDDGSTDNSRAIAEGFVPRVRVVAHPYNKGYGAALTTGTAAAHAHHVLYYDSDGQHTTEYVDMVLSKKDDFDMVVGARQGYKGPIARQPGKKLLHWVANYLVDFTIPDLNSGLRVVDRAKFFEFEHLYPQGFSLSSTITLAFIKHGYTVGYVPIKIEKREGGKSTVRFIRDGRRTLGLLTRLIMLFAPQKIFLPISGILFCLGILSFVYEFFQSFNIGENTILFLIAGLLVFLFGLLADQVASVRRELKIR